MIEKMKFYQKYKLKYTDRMAYNYYKYQLHLQGVTPPALEVPFKEIYDFKHSGNCGDIIYAIPAMLGLAGNSGCNLHLHLNQPAHFEKHITHPLGNVMLNSKIFEMFRPLMEHQQYINICDEYVAQTIDYDLDKFRQYPLKLDRGNIARWNMLVYPVAYDLNNAWLTAPIETGLNDAILIARSSRYNAPGINYKFLNKYRDVYFVGVEEEFKEMNKQITHLKYLPINNFLEMASYIVSAKLFIGNQSFPFSMAEAMKVNRLLEVYFRAPNVNVYGTKGFDFCFQPQFEYLVKKRYEDL